MKLNKYWILGLLLFGSVGCFEGDEPVVPVERFSKSIYADAGDNKRMVNFISLNQGEVIQQASPFDWEISYDENMLRINGFKSMQAAPISETWEETTDTNGLEFDYLTFGHYASIWKLEEGKSFLLNMGLNEQFETIGFYKFKFEKIDDEIIIEYQKLSGGDRSKKIFKQESFYFSLLNENEINLPAYSSVDFTLGRYTDFVTFIEQEEFYKVYGAVLGRTKAKRLEDQAYGEVSTALTEELEFSDSNELAIGWDWKKFDIDNGVYTIHEDLTYVLQDEQGFIYKLRFIDFYDDNGISGHPTFEYELL